MNINFKQCNSRNYRAGRLASIQYIVIHYTANRGDTAKNNADYFAREGGLNASAHYFVDESNVWQSVKDTDTAWHCGGGLQGSGGASFYQKCTNSNSIGIEMCLNDKNGNIRQGTVNNAIELTKTLMNKYNIPASRVIRHWDVTSKSCPGGFTGNNNANWNNFKAKLTTNTISTNVDISKMSTGHIKCTTCVNLRTQPNTSCGVITTLGNGTKVYIYSKNSGWYKVYVDGLSGYVSGDYLVEDIKPAPQPSTPTNTNAKEYTLSTKEISIDDKRYTVTSIMYKGENYIRLRDFVQAGYIVDYDSTNKLAKIKHS